MLLLMWWLHLLLQVGELQRSVIACFWRISMNLEVSEVGKLDVKHVVDWRVGGIDGLRLQILSSGRGGLHCSKLNQSLHTDVSLQDDDFFDAAVSGEKVVDPISGDEIVVLSAHEKDLLQLLLVDAWIIPMKADVSVDLVSVWIMERGEQHSIEALIIGQFLMPRVLDVHFATIDLNKAGGIVGVHGHGALEVFELKEGLILCTHHHNMNDLSVSGCQIFQVMLSNFGSEVAQMENS